MSELIFVEGDATEPQCPDTTLTDQPVIIAHICNDAGGWGAGFVMAISAKWHQPEEAYRKWHHDQTGDDRSGLLTLQLGHTQLVQVQGHPFHPTDDQKIWVANMIAQRGWTWTSDGTPPIRYDALKSAFERVVQEAGLLNASIHMPRIGCGLAGGTWPEVEKVLRGVLDYYELYDSNVYVYDLPKAA